MRGLLGLPMPVCPGAGGLKDLYRIRLRNPDILTSLDVLTTGKYLRLPTRYQVRRMSPEALVVRPILTSGWRLQTDFEPVEPISDGDVSRALHQLDGVIRYRLRIVEVVPAEMGSFRIGSFQSFCLRSVA